MSRNHSGTEIQSTMALRGPTESDIVVVPLHQNAWLHGSKCSSIIRAVTPTPIDFRQLQRYDQQSLVV